MGNGKEVFTFSEEYVTGGAVNIPKFHAILHYLNTIQALGSTDRYITKSPEHLHIDCAKEGYHASNHHDYLEQMAVWLQ